MLLVIPTSLGLFMEFSPPGFFPAWRLYIVQVRYGFEAAAELALRPAGRVPSGAQQLLVLPAYPLRQCTRSGQQTEKAGVDPFVAWEQPGVRPHDFSGPAVVLHANRERDLDWSRAIAISRGCAFVSEVIQVHHDSHDCRNSHSTHGTSA